jgi:DNA (cytosine-5)-methyltransferase 1
VSGLTFVDVCSGAGGLALGLEQAGFKPRLLLDDDDPSVTTLRTNRPHWNVLQTDLLDFDPAEHPVSYDVDLLAAGLPRVKSSATVGRADSGMEERLLEAAVYLVHAIRPRAVLIENVPGLAHADEYQQFRDFARAELAHLGYEFSWFVMNAVDFGVPQSRKQGVLVAVERNRAQAFRPPRAVGRTPPDGPPMPINRLQHWSEGRRTGAAPTWGRPEPSGSGRPWASTLTRWATRFPARSSYGIPNSAGTTW